MINILNYGLRYDITEFPGGERSYNVEPTELYNDGEVVRVYCMFQSSDDIVDLMLITNAIRYKLGNVPIMLTIPYFPAARADRVMVEGESFGLQVYAQMIKSCGFSKIKVYDPHSDVLTGMFEPGQLEVIEQYLCLDFPFHDYDAENSCIVAPDAGAVKKAFKVAKEARLPLIEAAKKRDVATGKILKTSIDRNDCLRYNNFIVVDDICDGGRTFIELAKAIKEINPYAKLHLSVTHGLFTKGKDELLQYFDSVYSTFDFTELKNGS